MHNNKRSPREYSDHVTESPDYYDRVKQSSVSLFRGGNDSVVKIVASNYRVRSEKVRTLDQGGVSKETATSTTRPQGPGVMAMRTTSAMRSWGPLGDGRAEHGDNHNNGHGGRASRCTVVWINQEYKLQWWGQQQIKRRMKAGLQRSRQLCRKKLYIGVRQILVCSRVNYK